MSEVVERLDNVEARLGSVETAVEALRGEVGDLRSEVGGLRGEVGELRGEGRQLRNEFGELRAEVGKLRVLGEQNTSDIKLIAEVQAHHGKKLEEITKALAPLAEIRDFMNLVAHDHEHRITALEKRTGVRE
jgi:chromosome segregation ATPase